MLNAVGQFVAVIRSPWEMFRQQFTGSHDAVHDADGEFTGAKMDGHDPRKFLPEVIAATGMNTLIRPSLYGAFHFAWPAHVEARFEPPRRGQTLDLPGLITCDIVGPICESGDFLAKDRKLPPVKAGDLIAIFAAGAYGMSMASTYNTQPRPAEVLVEGDKARIIRRRETLEEMLAPELGSHEVGRPNHYG